MMVSITSTSSSLNKTYDLSNDNIIDIFELVTLSKQVY